MPSAQQYISQAVKLLYMNNLQLGSKFLKPKLYYPISKRLMFTDLLFSPAIDTSSTMSWEVKNSDRNKADILLTYYQMKNRLQFSVIDTASTMILCWIKWVRPSTIAVFWAAVSYAIRVALSWSGSVWKGKFITTATIRSPFDTSSIFTWKNFRVKIVSH